MATIYQTKTRRQSDWIDFIQFTIRVIIAHTLTYFIFGILMSNLFDYGEVFKREIIRDYMFSMDEHNIVLGPFMQPIRGLIFAIGLWPLRGFLIERSAAGSFYGDCSSRWENYPHLRLHPVLLKEYSIPNCPCGIT